MSASYLATTAGIVRVHVRRERFVAGEGWEVRGVFYSKALGSWSKRTRMSRNLPAPPREASAEANADWHAHYGWRDDTEEAP
jgi:hypothetical protein